MTRSSVRAMVVREKRDLAALLRDLSPAEWERQSLCSRWRVRDVVAHLLYDSTPLLRYTYEVIRVAGSADKLNALYVDRARTWSIQRLLAAFESSANKSMAAKLEPTFALADLLIHHQDIRRPLGRPRVIPEEHLRTVLNHPDPFIQSKGRMRGLRWVATDIAWVHGDGPEIRGPGEAIVMAVAARPDALRQLDGAGVDILRARL